MDCNAAVQRMRLRRRRLCSGACSGTGCGCAFGDCNNRKAGCTRSATASATSTWAARPDRCRVITCVPPWALDGSCTTTVRVDGNTAGHDRSACTRWWAVLTPPPRPPAARVSRAGRSTSTPNRRSTWRFKRVDGGYVGSQSANVYRPDVGVAYRGWGDNHGFDFTVPVGGGAVKEVCVWGINAGAGSDNTFLGCRTVRLSTPFGAIDAVSAGSGSIRRPAGRSIRIRQVHSRCTCTSTTCSRVSSPPVFRPDVGSAYGYGNNHGFDITIPVAGGTHQVCVFAINQGAGSVNNQIGCRTINVGLPIGSVDMVTSAAGGLWIQGWAADPDTSGPIVVHAYVDNVFKGAFTADGFVPHIPSVFPGVGPNPRFRVHGRRGTRSTQRVRVRDQQRRRR